MSDKQQGTYSKSRLRELSAEQLKALLEDELASDQTDAAFIKCVTELLDEKTGTGQQVDVDAAWKEFQEDYAASRPLYPENDAPPAQPQRPRRRRGVRLVKGLAVAAAVLCLLTLTASAFGYNIWASVAKWTSEIFGLTGETGDERFPSADFPRYAPGLEELHAALEEHGVLENILPTWLPEGYEPITFFCKEYENGEIVFDLMLQKEGVERLLDVFYIVRTDDTFVQYQKDAGDPEIYETGGVTHYIMTNMGEYFAVWINGRVECSFSGFASREELIRAIDSIYVE